VRWSVRPARPEDAAVIHRLNREALGYECPPEAVAAQLERVLKRPADRVFVVWDEDAGHVAGFGHAADYETLHAGSMKNILSLAVENDRRGLGLGRMLVEAVETWARADGCEAVRLVSSFGRTHAHGFYLHCGYRLRKEQNNFIKAI